LFGVCLGFVWVTFGKMGFNPRKPYTNPEQLPNKPLMVFLFGTDNQFIVFLKITKKGVRKEKKD